MKQSPKTDPLLGFIRQQVEQFEEVPSEKVWEGLEARWQQPRLRGRSTLLILLVSAAATLGISAMLSWNLLFPPASPIEIREFVRVDECEETLLSPEKAEVAVSVSPPVYQANPQLFQVQALPTMPQTSLVAERSFPVVDSVHFVPLETSVLTPLAVEGDDSTNHEPTPIAEKKRASLRLGQLFQQLSKRRKGNNWDYQLGLRVGTSNFTNSIMRDFNSLSSVYQVEGLVEWVLHPRFRLQTGIAYERMMFDYGSPNWGIAEIQSMISFYELPIDPNHVVNIGRKNVTHSVMLPIEVLFFITPPEPETQVWAGIGFRQEVFSHYRLDYEFEVTEGEHFVVSEETGQMSDFANRAFLFRLGVEQRLTSALRLRLSGFYYAPVYGGLLQMGRAYHQQLGGSLSLFWASKRGPMRWRNKRTKRR